MSEQKREMEPGMDIRLGAEGRQSYAQMLQLDKILDAQRPFQTPATHDEMLFTIIHQVSELWLKLMLHELKGATRDIAAGDLNPSFKKMSRVKQIQRQMTAAWDVLRTMTPSDYLQFRGALGPASGFQSYGYRLVEFALGNKDEAHLRVHAHDPEAQAGLDAALNEPSLYDVSIALLARRGFSIAPETLNRNLREPHEFSQSLMDAWRAVYTDTSQYWDLYDLAEKLIDIEDNFQDWRFSHVQTVKRIIGMKPGTGGSSGVPFLQKALNISFFPELYALRSVL